jgi:molybdopterin/thiamine biosynthesis adenylyltransferase/rhodanese-related sulfurtransferase
VNDTAGPLFRGARRSALGTLHPPYLPDMTDPDFTPLELQRYARHLALPGIGLEGQRRLRAASVLVVGAGGLGSPAALYLAAAGVGRLGIVDFDLVDASNLQRQVLHATADVGRPKVESAAARLRGLNPFVAVEMHQLQLDAGNAGALVARYDIVIDGTDNFAARYVLSDACVRAGRPCVHASIHRFEGQATLLVADGAPCYRCLFREPPPLGTAPSCAEAGVFGVLPGILGTIQAAEAIKIITGVGDTLAGRLLLVDVARMRFQTVALRRDPGCPACGDDARLASGGRSSTASAEKGLGTRSTRGGPPPEPISHAAAADAPPFPRAAEPTGALPEIAPRELAERIARGEDLALLDVREPWEHAIASVPGARLVPLGALRALAHTVDPARETIVLCHHGVRSAAAVELLREAGVARARNLAGGIDRWSLDVDRSVPRY